jgi:hypothetical protein
MRILVVVAFIASLAVCAISASGVISDEALAQPQPATIKLLELQHISRA